MDIQASGSAQGARVCAAPAPARLECGSGSPLAAAAASWSALMVGTPAYVYDHEHRHAHVRACAFERHSAADSPGEGEGETNQLVTFLRKALAGSNGLACAAGGWRGPPYVADAVWLGPPPPLASTFVM